jgi:DNA-binding transcriptional ArsR family regulator
MSLETMDSRNSEVMDFGRVIAALPDEESCARLAEFYSAFADSSRIKIISALKAAGELCVKDIAQITGSSESAISHQLKILRLMRLVTSRNEGRSVIYRLDDDHIYDILRAGADHIRE